MSSSQSVNYQHIQAALYCRVKLLVCLPSSRVFGAEGWVKLFVFLFLQPVDASSAGRLACADAILSAADVICGHVADVTAEMETSVATTAMEVRCGDSSSHTTQLR